MDLSISSAPMHMQSPLVRADWADVAPPVVHRRTVAALAKWRLNKAIDFIEANLATPILLADMAAAAGLTRMHFAAQFRAATGLRPREYLLRRRIERAQALLATPEVSLVDTALSVGFQTQAHFSAVFRRFVGQTPGGWRRVNLGMSGNH